MGYSHSAEAVNRVERFLNALKDSREDKVIWESADAKKLQYFIHSGLSAAETLKHPVFGELKRDWKIRLNKNIVTAERKVPISASTAIYVVYGVKDLYSLVGKLTELKDRERALSFPEIDLNSEEIDKLRMWCEANKFIYTYKERTVYVEKL